FRERAFQSKNKQVVTTLEVQCVQSASCPRGSWFYLDLLHPQRPALLFQHGVEESDYMRTDQFAGHAQPADVAGRDRRIGPGAYHALGKLALRRARHNAHFGEALAHDYSDDQIVFVE